MIKLALVIVGLAILAGLIAGEGLALAFDPIVQAIAGG